MNFYKIIKELRRENSLKSLYSGYTMNCLRITMRELYRWPMYLGLSSFYDNHFRNPYMVKTLTGMTIAMVEVYILCPLERIKVNHQYRLFS